MFPFLKRNPGLGIEITSAAVRVVALSGRDGNTKVLSGRADLPAGLVSETYASSNIQDREGLAQVLRSCLNNTVSGQARRTALSLPDGIFRVQTLEFDELPKKAADRERLIRWRLEKTAAFDLSDTLLRYEILRRQDAGYSILACIAKKPVIAQYESLLIELGLEPWSIGLSSFYTLNFYSPYMSKRSGSYALIHVTDESFVTIVYGNGGARFYRFKDIKRGGADEIRSRLMREIDDSLHFYTHMDRSQQAEVRHLYLSGERVVRDALAGELTTETSLAVEVLSPEAVLPSAAGTAAEMAAALGAGKTL